MRRSDRVYLIGLLLLSFALRLYHLDTQSIWVDEGISLHLATSSLTEIVADRAANIHPPLYFLMLKGWIALTGTSAFSTRFFSALISLLQVVAAYAIARRWLGRRTAQAAALLTALSPVSVVYAQEVRVYAVLPLVYLALMGITHQLVNSPTSRRRVLWLLLGITELVGLHLHYVVLAVLAYTGAWLLLTLLRERHWADLRRWWLTQLLVGLASLPWLIAILSRWPDVQVRLETGLALTEPIPLDYLLSQVWVFHLTGLAGALGRPVMRLLASLALLQLLALLVLQLHQPSARRSLGRLTAHWLFPLSGALLLWRMRSFSHPRYTAIYLPGLIFLAAHAIYPNRTAPQTTSRKSLHAARGLLSATLTITLVLTFVLALRAYFFDPAFAKDDVEGVARHLEETSGRDDLILVPDADWSLTFAYNGEAPIEMPALADEEEMWTNLTNWTAHRRRVFVTDYRREFRDWRDVFFFALERAGTRVAHEKFRGLSVLLYQLDRQIEPPTLAASGARFESLILTDAWVEAEAPADTAVTLALRWRLEETTDRRYGLTIHLTDVDGYPLTAQDGLLLDGQIRPSDRWPAGKEITTYHILPIPSGTPPLTYTLTAGLYAQTESGLSPLNLLDDQGAPRGQRLELSTVRLTAPQGIEGTPYGANRDMPSLPQPTDVASGLQLVGATIDRPALAPGQPLFVVLRWQAIRAPLPDLRPRLALIQADQELDANASAPALGRYPTDLWSAGETVVEHRRLVVPPTAAEGLAHVVLSLGNRRFVLGQVEIAVEEHVFTPPPIAYPLDVRFGEIARLIGYDLPSEVSGQATSADPITLTLFWEALEGGNNAEYVVFTHILASDGHLVGQHDAPPANGTRPTAGWLAGEIIADQHLMTFVESYAGLARIEVGLYDPATMERVPVEGGETSVLLPTALTILEH